MGSTCNSWIRRKQLLYVPITSFLHGLLAVRASLSQISITPVPVANNQLHAFHAFCRNYLPTTSLRLLVSIMILLWAPRKIARPLDSDRIELWAPRKIAGCDGSMAILGIQGHDSHGLVAAESRIFLGALKYFFSLTVRTLRISREP